MATPNPRLGRKKDSRRIVEENDNEPLRVDLETIRAMSAPPREKKLLVRCPYAGANSVENVRESCKDGFHAFRNAGNPHRSQ